MSKNGRLRMGMIGGGPGALIGQIHRKAARMDGRIDLVGGAFSGDPDKSRRQGEELGLDPKRVHGAWPDLIRAEAALPEGERMDFVAVVTPNHLHLEPALAALAAGFHVVLDKPMTVTAAEARRLRDAVAASGRLFALTHPFSSLAMVKLARDLIRAGRLGTIRKINAEFRQGWLHKRIEDTDKQAAWRTDPARSGAGCLGDIGTHIFNLAESLTGLRLLEVAAEVTTFVAGRGNDDDFSALTRWEGGAKGVIHAGQALSGAESDLFIQVYGDEAGLEWRYSDNPRLLVRRPGQPVEIWTRGTPAVAAASPDAARDSRSMGCHPEGSQEGFLNIYANFADAVLAARAGTPAAALAKTYPDVEDGYRGMLFVEAALASSRAGGEWTRLE